MELDWPEIWLHFQQSQSTGYWPNAISTLAGALAGGLLVFLTSLFFEVWKRRDREKYTDFDLYIAINQAIHDVNSFGSPYIEQLGYKSWPSNPWQKIKPTADVAFEQFRFTGEQLSIFRGRLAEGLTHELFEIANFRSTLVEINSKFSTMHQEFTRQASAFAIDIESTNQILSGFDKSDPSQKPLIVMAQQLDALFKALIAAVFDYYEKVIRFSQKYNDYKANHPRRDMRGLRLDVSGLTEMLSARPASAS